LEELRMQQWAVRDVMTENVVAVPAETPYKDLAETLTRHRVSAVPVVDAAGAVIGVVSEADMLYKLENADREPHLRFLERKQRRAERAKATADVAAELMSAPAVVIGPSESVAAAAKLMDRERVKRLPVVDADGRLLGIVSRGDLLRIYLRDDEKIREEILDQVLHRTLWIDPSTISVSVERGVVTLAGAADRRSTKGLIVRLVAGVTGVVDIVDGMSYDYDDTADLRRGGYLMRPSIEDMAPGKGI
jgi:CBS domain-containing protein